MASTVLNEAQLSILRLLGSMKTVEEVDELRQVICDYFAQKAEKEIDKLREDGTLTETKVEGFRSLHERTTYNRNK